MTLKQLMYFQKMAVELNYTKAARDLYISQPSLSYTIKALEQELSAKLFEKDPSTNRLRLTADGIVFLRHVDAAMSSLDAGIQAVSGQKGVQSTIRIGYIHTFPLDFIQNLLDSYMLETDNPDITFKKEISTSNVDLLSHLEKGKLNFAFSLSLNSHVTGIPLIHQALFVTVSKEHPLASRGIVTPQELAQYPLVRVAHAIEINSAVDDMFSRAGIIPELGAEAGNLFASLAHLIDNSHYTVAPMLSGIDTSRFTRLSVEGHLLSRPIYFAWNPKEILSPTARSFFSFIMNQSTDLSRTP